MQYLALKSNEHLVHLAVVRQHLQINARGYSESENSFLQVSGGGRKPWRQKGTGHARWIYPCCTVDEADGIIFAPTPRDYEVKMNKRKKSSS